MHRISHCLAFAVDYRTDSTDSTAALDRAAALAYSPAGVSWAPNACQWRFSIVLMVAVTICPWEAPRKALVLRDTGFGTQGLLPVLPAWG